MGKEYELIITNKSGLYRYRVGDVVRVMGYYHEMPMVQCAYRKNEIIRLTCEKTSEVMVNWMIEEFCKDTGVSLTNFSIYGDTNASPQDIFSCLNRKKPLKRRKFQNMKSF